MTIEEAEIIFEKRWNLWTEEEWDEFLECITPEQLGIAGILAKVCDRIEQNRGHRLPANIQARMTELMLT